MPLKDSGGANFKGFVNIFLYPSLQRLDQPMHSKVPELRSGKCRDRCKRVVLEIIGYGFTLGK